MAVQEKTHAPASSRSEAAKASSVVTPARPPARPGPSAKKKPTEISDAATPVQRARTSAAMQQRMGNARAEQMISGAPAATLQITAPLERAGSKPSMVVPKIIVPLIVPKPGAERERKAPAEKGLTAAPEKEAAEATPPAKAETATKESKAPATTSAPDDKGTTEKAESAETRGKDAKPTAEAGGEAKPSAADGGKKSADEGESAKLPEEGAGKSAPVAVKLHIPEPPSEISPATKRRIGGVQARAGGAAKAHSNLPEGAKQVGDARKAVDEPNAEAIAKAQAALISQVPAAPSPEIVKLCERIRDVIYNKRPPDQDALMEAKPEGAALSAGNQLNSTVEGETKKVQDNYGAVNAPPGAVAPAKGEGLAPQPPVGEATPINAKAATPDAVPAENVSLDADAAESKKKMEAAGMEKPAAQLVQSGPVAEARGAQGELDQAAKEDPAKVLAGQQESLAKAETNMAALQAQALEELTKSRAATVEGTASRQQGMVGSEESMRTKASAEAKKAFDDAQKSVNALLKPVASNAMEAWDKAKDVLVTKFKADLAIVQQRVDERHKGVGGFFKGLWDAVAGLPSWAEAAYTAAERKFGDGVIAKLTEISIQVNSVIATCDLIIKNARDRIAKIFADLPESLRGWATQEQGKFDGQLDQLHNQAISARDNFNKELKDSASAAVDEVRTEIAELRKKAGGLVGRIVSAVNRFLDDPVKFIIEGLLELLGIPPAAFWAVVAKIKQVVKDIADDPMKFGNNLLAGLAKGFSQFFDNFFMHMVKGFISWITGGLGDVGVQLPKDFSLKSIITFFLQLMGITWPRIRKVLAKHVGQKNVALLEKVFSLLSLLIEKGPEGIYEMIKEKLDPQSILDQVIDLAVDFMVSAIIKAATARIILLFNPAGAILQALEAIYRVLKWIFQNAARIFTLVETVVNGIADILAGSIGGFANAVEKALAMLIAPVISFIADYLGFGDLPDKIANKIKTFQDWIMELIEKALVWLIEKGKALLAAVGIGKKDKDKDKKGGGAEQVGEEVDFEAGGESHRLWIDVSGSNATLMVASTQQSVNQYLSHVERNGPPDLSSKAKEARQLAETTDHDADEVAKIAVHVPDEKETPNQAKLTEKQANLKGKEKQLADLLKEIFEGMNPIRPRLGKPIDEIKKTPYGYELKPDSGDYEYGGSYSNTEIERGKGFGSADEKAFPMVHVDEAALVQEGPGLLQSDWPVIHDYEAEIAGVQKRLADDEAPQLKGGPLGPSSQLRSGGRKKRSFTRGIRKQMEAIVKAIRAGEDITGIEVVVGKRRIDYTTRIKIGTKSANVLVEYKHWTGKLTPARRTELSNKLQAQLEGQISGGKGQYSILMVVWPAFGDLDATSQERFREVIADVTEFGTERGIKVIF